MDGRAHERTERPDDRHSAAPRFTHARAVAGALDSRYLFSAATWALLGRNAVEDFDDRWAYSDDMLYRWWWERRWGDEPGLCWVGLNPSTGDTTKRPRPTLRKVVALAKAHGLGAVTVVNLFSWRATKPADLKRAAAEHDIVGARTDSVILEISSRSTITLAAWGSHGSLLGRGNAVAGLLSSPVCLGTTAGGEPRHPLYLPAATELHPYEPPRG